MLVEKVTLFRATRPAAKTVRRVLRLYDGIGEQTARRMVDQWRFFGDFRTAMKTLDVGSAVHG